MRRLAIALFPCLWACGDNHLGVPDAPGAGPFQPAPHAPMPRVFPHTGTVLSAMQLVTITFDNYDAAHDVEAFGDALVVSHWYEAVGAEYGMSRGTHVKKARIGAAPAALDRAQIAARIIDLIARGALPAPAAIDNQLLYLMYIPPTVARGQDLQALRGYHEMLTFDDARFPIAVVLDDGSGLAATTTMAAHQLINAATNPYTRPNDGYYTDPPMTDPWSLVRNEIADLCEGEALYIDNGIAYPRVWSSTAAQDSQPPCFPPIPGDTWNDVTAKPSRIQTLPPGGSVSFRLTGWSTSELPAWKIRVRTAESSDLADPEIMPELSDDTINNNDTVTLTLHAPPGAADGATGVVYVLSGTHTHRWAIGFTVLASEP